MEVDRLKREDLEKLLRSPALEIHDILKVAKDEFEVEIEVDESLSREETIEQIIDEVFDAYNRATIEVENDKYKLKVQKKTRTRKSKSADGKVSRKEFIINLVSEGKHDKNDIVEIVNEEYGYTKRGRSSKTRVGKTIRELKASKVLSEAADGTLSIKKR